jgi:hypothetical protein
MDMYFGESIGERKCNDLRLVFPEFFFFLLLVLLYLLLSLASSVFDLFGSVFGRLSEHVDSRDREVLHSRAGYC